MTVRLACPASSRAGMRLCRNAETEITYGLMRPVCKTCMPSLDFLYGSQGQNKEDYAHDRENETAIAVMQWPGKENGVHGGAKDGDRGNADRVLKDDNWHSQNNQR